MNSRSLYKLIHNLTPAQKANFSSYLSSGKRKSGKYKVLYDRILSTPLFDEREIRGKEFSSSVAYYQNREILLDKIVQSLVFYQDAKVSFRGYVIQALEIDAFELARKKFLAELDQAVAGHDLDYIHYLLSFQARVERAHQVQLINAEEIESAEKLVVEKATVDQLQHLFARVKRWIKNGIDEIGRVGIASVYAELDQIHAIHPEASYWDAKTRSGLAMLELDIPASFAHLGKAVSVLEKYSFPFSNGLLIRESYLMIQLTHHVHDLETAMEMTMQFALLKTHNPREEALKKEFWAKSAIRTGIATANLELVRSALPDLLSHKNITPQSVVLNLFYAAKVAFLNQEFKLALRWLREFRILKSSAVPELNWAAEQLRLMTHIEVGDWDACESAYRTSLRLAMKLEAPNLKLGTKIAFKAMDAMTPAAYETLFKQYQEAFQPVAGASKENVALDLMNISFWLESRASNVAMIEIYKRETMVKPTVKLSKSV